MIKRRAMALAAASGFILLAGLTGSAMADEAPTAGSTGTCVTSDGKTFEFTEAVPATKAEVATEVGAASITVERADDGSVAFKEGGAVPADAVPATATVPATEAIPASEVTMADGGAQAVTVTCTAK